MNIREAILRAADHIERSPLEFDFSSIDAPDYPGCGTPACALGWVSLFRRTADDWTSAVGVDDDVFYSRMDLFDGHDAMSAGLWGPWTNSAIHCAKNLRLYADKYHPAEKPAGIPDAVRDIFAMTPEQIGAALAAA